MKDKFIKNTDEVGITVYSLAGHSWASGNIMVRIFAEKKPRFLGSSERVMRYFPQIDDEEKEECLLIGPECGYQYLKEAKEETIKAWKQYQAHGLNSFLV